MTPHLPIVSQAEEEQEGLDGEGGDAFGLARHARRVLQLAPSSYRAAFLAVLRGGDALAASAAVRVLLALLLCRHVDPALLDAAGRFPTIIAVTQFVTQRPGLKPLAGARGAYVVLIVAG